MTLTTKDATKVFDDTLDPMGGLALFSVAKSSFGKSFPWLNEASDKEWEAFGRIYYGYNPGTIYVRFVDPCDPRFGSIAKLVNRPNFRHSWSAPMGRVAHTPAEQDAAVQQLAQIRTLYTDLQWDKRSNRPRFSTYEYSVEYLPKYTGETVWKYDRDRAKRFAQKPAFDRLEREIKVGDFCTYILYQFDGSGAAGIYFGTVTRIEKDGQVFCKNVPLKSNERVAEKPVKDNRLITILTDDLMRQLMLAKLSA